MQCGSQGFIALRYGTLNNNPLYLERAGMCKLKILTASDLFGWSIYSENGGAVVAPSPARFNMIQCIPFRACPVMMELWDPVA